MLYAVGKPWEKGDDALGVAFYTCPGEIRNGDLKEAQDFLKYVEKQTGEKHYIYKVERLE